MPNFIMICGPQAVGKMTVGQETKLDATIMDILAREFDGSYIKNKNCYNLRKDIKYEEI